VTALAVGLGASDVLLAVMVMMVFARPDSALGLAAWLSGRDDAPDSDALESDAPESDDLALYRTVGRLRWLLLAALFAWSFVCGALITMLRM